MQFTQVLPVLSDIVDTQHKHLGIKMPKRYDLEKFSDSKNLQTSKALELIMRDVIDGMEELANMSGFSPRGGHCFEILGIDSPENFVDSPLPATETEKAGQDSAVVIPLKRKKQAAA